MRTLWISPFIKACFSSLNTVLLGGFKYYILCSVLSSLRNNPVGCFYAIFVILRRILLCWQNTRAYDNWIVSFPLGEDFTPVGFLAEVRLQDDCRSISLEGLKTLKEIIIETPR